MKNEMKRTAISIVILGEKAVGKTMICSRFLGLEFRNEHLTTVGIDKMTKTIKLDTGEEIKLKLWDTAGQERFRSISLKNVHYSQAAVVVFDLTEKESFEKVTDWLKEIRENEPSIPISLFGNKSDLKEKRVVDQNDIDALCENETLELNTSVKRLTGTLFFSFKHSRYSPSSFCSKLIKQMSSLYQRLLLNLSAETIL